MKYMKIVLNQTGIYYYNTFNTMQCLPFWNVCGGRKTSDFRSNYTT